MAVVIVSLEPSNGRKHGDQGTKNDERKLRHATEKRNASDREHHASYQKPGPPANADGAHHEVTTRLLVAAWLSRKNAPESRGHGS